MKSENKIQSPWLEPSEAAAFLKVSERTIQRYRKAGRLPFYQLTPTSNQIRYRLEDLNFMMENSLRWFRK